MVDVIDLDPRGLSGIVCSPLCRRTRYSTVRTMSSTLSVVFDGSSDPPSLFNL